MNFVLDHFTLDPAITPISATRHQLVTLQQSIYLEERAQTLESLMGSKDFLRSLHLFTSFPFSLYASLFAELDDVLTHLGQSYWPSCPRVMETNDTSGDETDAG